MDALKAEVERKRKEREALAASGGGGGGPRKWVRRGEVEAQKAVKYHETEAAEQEERARKAMAPQHRVAKQIAEEEAAQATAAGGGGATSTAHAAPTSVSLTSTSHAASQAAASSSAASKESAADKLKDLRPAEVMRRLRGLSQPIVLFGESDESRLERYRAIASVMPSEAQVDLEMQKGMTWGQSERQLFDASGKAKHESAKQARLDEADIHDDEEELAPSFIASTPEETISRHFKQLIKLWEGELDAREPAEVGSQQGRTATAAFQQTKRHMKPFFKLLKDREMPLDLMGFMVEITTYMQQREYVKAHDSYIKCAIGTAAWPMGITGTGIHERQGRQHLREDKIAHVMNDETQRKYLQSVKRLLTFSQRALPPSGPSKAVLNGTMI